MNKKNMLLVALAILIFTVVIYIFNKDNIVDIIEDANTTIIVNGNPDEKVKRDVKLKFVDKFVQSQKNGNETLDVKIDSTNLEDIATAELFKVRKIIPYAKEKPPAPDEEENNSTLYGVDANGNGVRDDLEILAIDQFGYDGELVESIFAGIRTYDYNMYVVDNNLLEDESVMKEVINNIDKSYNCQSYFYGERFYDESVGAIDGYADNSLRQKNVTYLARRLHGVADDFVTNEKNCKKFFEKTKEYNYR